MDDDEYEYEYFDEENLPVEVQEMLADAASHEAKQYGAAIEAVDELYEFVNRLNEKDTDAFLKIMQGCSQAPEQPVFWCGYARAIRFSKFGTNPNPYAPEIDTTKLLLESE